MWRTVESRWCLTEAGSFYDKANHLGKGHSLSLLCGEVDPSQWIVCEPFWYLVRLSLPIFIQKHVLPDGYWSRRAKQATNVSVGGLMLYVQGILATYFDLWGLVLFDPGGFIQDQVKFVFRNWEIGFPELGNGHGTMVSYLGFRSNLSCLCTYNYFSPECPILLQYID